MLDMQTNVEVLKTEMRGLQTGMSEVAAKMDMLISMQVQLVRLQEQHDTHRQALDRAFSSIRANGEELRKVDSDFHKAYSFIKGGALVGAMLLGFIQWYVVGQINTLQQVDVDIKAIDRRIAAVEYQIRSDVAGGGK
jgi:hypothetical protein